MASIHKASSSTWQDEAVPRLCQIVLEANTGIAQQIAENRTELLDILPLSALIAPTDDLGLTPAFLAVYYDRPEMLDYLFKRGVDLKAPCDPMGFGAPMFYAVSMGKTRLISQLDFMGCSIGTACDKLGQLPMVHAVRMDNHSSIDTIAWASGKEKRAYILFMKHWKRIKCRKHYFKMRAAIPYIQRVARGMLGRRRFKKFWIELQTKQRRDERRRIRDQKIADGVELDEEDEDTVAPDAEESLAEAESL